MEVREGLLVMAQKKILQIVEKVYNLPPIRCAQCQQPTRHLRAAAVTRVSVTAGSACDTQHKYWLVRALNTIL